MLNKLASFGKANTCVIYTAIVAGYDELPVVDNPEDDIDYICFCDEDIPQRAPWQLRKFTRVFADPQRDARRIKILPHLFLPEYSISLWIDATVHINKCPSSYFFECTPDAAIACALHTERDCLYEEAEAVLGYGVDDEGIVRTQMDKYKNMGIPLHDGLHVTTFMFRRHHSPECRRFAYLWWQELSYQSKRDQLSFDFVRSILRQKVVNVPYLMDEGDILRWGEGHYWHKAGTEARMLNRRFWASPNLALAADGRYHEYDISREFLLIAQKLFPGCSYQSKEKLPLPCSNGAAERNVLSLLLKAGNRAVFLGEFSPLWLLWAVDVARSDLKLTLVGGIGSQQSTVSRSLEAIISGRITLSPATINTLFEHGISRWFQRFDIVILHAEAIHEDKHLKLLVASMPLGGKLMLWGESVQWKKYKNLLKALPLVQLQNFLSCYVFEKKE